MRIIIPTNDKITLAERSGRAKWFLIFDIENQLIKSTEELANNHDHSHSSGWGHSHADMVKLFVDCQLMITKKAGPNFRLELQEANIKVEIVESNLITEALEPYL